MHDLRRAARTLTKSPGFGLAAVLMLGLAIGVNAAAFSVIDKVLLQPLPIQESDRVVVIWPRERANPTTIGEISNWTLRQWQQKARSFEMLAGAGSVTWSMVARVDRDSATVQVAAVSGSFFPLIRTAAARGRTLVPEDDKLGAPNVAVISHRGWLRRFGGDPEVVGRRLILNETTYTIVGVMADGFDYPRSAEFWVPVTAPLAAASTQYGVDTLQAPSFGVLFLVGRLRDGVTAAQARTELATFIDQNDGGAFRPGMEPAITRIRDHILGKTQPALLALTVSVGLVLLIACANVATLLLVRANARNHETAIRVSLGARRWDLMRQPVVDVLVLSVVGGLVGIVLGRWMVAGLVFLAPPDVPRLDAVRFDGRTLSFTWIVCLAVSLIAGIGPSLHVSRWNLAEVLGKGGSRLTRNMRLRRAFIVAQIGIALTLLVGTGLIARSFVNVLRVELGFDAANVLTLDVTVPGASAERRNAFYTALLERVETLPGVDVAGGISLRPLEHAAVGLDATILIEGQSTDLKRREWEQNPTANYEVVTPGYFRAIGMRVLRGRAFTASDTAQAQQVVIISDGLARRLWRDADAIGKRLLRPDAPQNAKGEPLWSTVVGVVENARYRGIADVRFDLYVPYLQKPGDPVQHVMVRTSRAPMTLGSAIRAEAHRLEPTALVEAIRPMEELVGRAIAPWRFTVSTLAVLGAIALVLSGFGIYGVIRQATADRVRELGLRMALGAGPINIVKLVLREGFTMTALGIGVGAIGAIAAGRVLDVLLFDVSPIDPIAFIAATGLFVIAATLATLVPALNAARVDPLVALRYE